MHRGRGDFYALSVLLSSLLEVRSDSRAKLGLGTCTWIAILHAGGSRFKDELEIGVIGHDCGQLGIGPSPKVPAKISSLCLTVC